MTASRRNKTVQKPPAFRWTAQREKAAVLDADDQLTDEQIAERLGKRIFGSAAFLLARWPAARSAVALDLDRNQSQL